MIRRAFILSAALAAALAAASPERAQELAAKSPTLPSVALPPELARVLTDYEKAWRAHDAARLALAAVGVRLSVARCLRSHAITSSRR